MANKMGRPWWRYSPEFKQQAVERMKAGGGVTALARQLGIRRKLLYEWREQGYGGDASVQRGRDPAEALESPLDRENKRLKRKVAELERLLGRQAGELDFFAAALRSVEELRPSKGNSSGGESTPSSKPLRKAPDKR